MFVSRYSENYVWEIFHMNLIPGDICEYETDECASSPCQFGGSCIDSVNEFSCSCITGFIGMQQNAIRNISFSQEIEKNIYKRPKNFQL